MFSLNFPITSPWCSPIILKFGSRNIQHWRKDCRKLAFWVYLEQLLSNIFFARLHCYKVTLEEKYNKPLLQNIETTIFDQKRCHKKLVQSQWEENSGVLRLNQVMCKLLILNCLHFKQLFTYHLSYVTFHTLIEVLYY